MNRRDALLLMLMFMEVACAEDTAAESITAFADVAGLYHLADSADAINLELRPDHSFRWASQGCDTFGNDQGRFKVDSATAIVLVPDIGRSAFSWPAQTVSPMAELHLEVGSEKLVDSIEAGGFGQQIWEPGGVCASCGNLGSSGGLHACDAPFSGF